MKILLLLLSLIVLTSNLAFAQSGHWEQLFPQNSPPKSIMFGMAQLTKGKVLVLTGFINNNQIVSETWLFDYKENNWTKLNIKNPPPSRKGMSMAQLTDGKIIMFGGADEMSPDFNDTWLFDLENMDWTLLNTDGKPFRREGGILSKINDNDMLLYAGDIVDSLMPSLNNDTWLFSYKNMSWRAVCLADCPTHSRQGMQMSQLTENKVLLFGGENTGLEFEDNWIFDRNDLKWTRIYPIDNSINISYSSMAKLQDGYVVWACGYYNNTNSVNDVWIYNYNINKWKKAWVTNPPPPRCYNNLALIDSNKVLLFGGTGHTDYYNETWLLTIDSLTDVKDDIFNNGDFEISPNPATYFIEISGINPMVNHGVDGSHVRLYDVFGQNCNLTPALSTNGEGVKLDVSCLAPGMYFVRIGDKVGKFVKL